MPIISINQAELWYEFTDVEVEVELLGDYQDWLKHQHVGVAAAGFEERQRFYAGLQRELDVNRLETKKEFEDVKKRMYPNRK